MNPKSAKLPLKKIVLASSLILSYILTGCAESKTFQCQKIVKIANQVNQETAKMTKSGQEIEIKNWLIAADELEKASQEMAKLTLTDEQLKEYQRGFSQVYQDFADSTREIVKVWQTKDRIAAKAAQEKVKRAGKSERELGEQMNKYCRTD